MVEGVEFPAEIKIHGIRQSFVGGGLVLFTDCRLWCAIWHWDRAGSGLLTLKYSDGVG